MSLKCIHFSLLSVRSLDLSIKLRLRLNAQGRRLSKDCIMIEEVYKENEQYKN